MDTKFFLTLFVVFGCGSSAGGNGNAHGSGGAGASAGGAGGVAVTASGGGALGGGAVGGTAPGNSGGSTNGGGANASTGGAGTIGGGGTISGSGGMRGAGGPGVAGGVNGGAPSTGGATQGGGGATTSGDVSRSAGCGKTAPMAGNLDIDVMGMSRAYILALPSNYDPNTAYRLIFAWHGLGGSAQQIAQSGYYGLKTQSANSAIFVAGQGLMTSTSVGNGAGWPNTNGQDVAFVKALYAQLQSQACFDQNRVFSVGMSYGGIMSDTLGCQMGDVFRAIAPMSGSGPGYGNFKPKCVGQVAVWLSNGDNDTVVPTAQEEASRDYWVSANHCQMTSMPVDPSPCVAYQGCDPGNPVTWCEFMGGHTVPSFAPAAIWKFFSQF